MNLNTEKVVTDQNVMVFLNQRKQITTMIIQISTIELISNVLLITC